MNFLAGKHTVPDIDSPLQAVARLLKEQQPSTLLLCSHSDMPGLEQYTSQKRCATTRLRVDINMRELAELGRFDLAIVADQLEHLPKTAGMALLGRIRNVHSNHFCVLYAPAGRSSAWTAVDFFSLGMTLSSTFLNDGRELQLYTYAIEKYNRRREWNNSRYWANPENFGKYWW